MRLSSIVFSVCVLLHLSLFSSARFLISQETTQGLSEKQTHGVVTFSTQDDHRDMQKQLGITKLRSGPSGDPKNPNAANTDESKANPYPNLPDLLTLKNGSKVTTSEQWWKQRRPEIVEDFEREVLGRIPKGVPSVAWNVVKTLERKLGETDVIEKRIIGRADNSECPEIEVNIMMSVILPKDAKGSVPALMQFGFTAWGLDGEDMSTGGRRLGEPRPGDPPSREQQLIEAGWAAVTINANSIQEDSGGEQQRRFGPPRPVGQTGGGLTRGIIGLTNKGQSRKPDQWGSLRAWGWGASRGLDYLEKEPTIDAKRVGIDGVSRYGKAALVTMAFDERFAMALVASSGEGGASLYRRNFGEAVENLTGSGEYHWMAGNFLKYGTEESSFGTKNASDLPVDAHMLIALCAPRMTFISYGIPEKGDALWLDQQGSFMATIAAQPAFRLLGARDLGRSDDYNSEKLPPANTDLLDGELAWRQHDGGHTDLPNIPHFIKWANRLFEKPKAGAILSSSGRSSEPSNPKSRPIQREDPNSLLAHQQLIEKTKRGKIDVYFVGDSITRRWGATDYPAFLANWKRNFFGWNAANFGWGGDTTNNILWRLQNGELDNVAPRVFVLQAGTNNLPWTGSADVSKVEEVVSGVKSIVGLMLQKSPNSKVVLTALFPRSQNPALSSTILQINEQLAKLADGNAIRFLNINSKLTDSTGAFLPGFSEDGLHFTEKSYQLWANGLSPIFLEILGPPSPEDHAPPATGDPKADTSSATKKASEPASRLTTPGAADIPNAVRIQRPTRDEFTVAEKAVAAAQEKPRLVPKPIVNYPLGEESKVNGELKGKLEGPFLFKSKIIENTVRKYWIYVPSMYSPDKPAAVLVFQDGARATNPNGVLRVQNVLENLSVSRKIPTTIGIFITPGERGEEFPNEIGTGNPNNRDREYDVLDDKYARFIVEEMLPEVGKKYNLTSDPALRAIGGSSSGAICAFTVAWHRPDQFRNVISMIGSFTNIHGGHVYPDLILNGKKKPIRIFLQDGINDLRSPQNLDRDWYLQNQKMKAALEEKGYDYAFVLGEGGHSDDHGGAMLPQMLRWIWRDASGVEPATSDLIAEAAAIKPIIADPFPGLDATQSVDVTGAWKWDRTVGPSRMQYTLQLTMVGNKVEGTLLTKRGEEEPDSQAISNVELQGNKIDFVANSQFRDTKVPTSYAAIVKDRKMVGWIMSELNGSQRDTRWECSRQ